MKDHPISSMFPLMDEADLKELAADIAEHGLREPIFTLDAMILDGRNRYRACLIAGVEPEMSEYRGKNPKDFVHSINYHRRHLTREQKRISIAKRLKETPEQSDRSIATEVKADHKTVADVRAELESGGEIPHLEETKGKDGKTQKVRGAKAEPNPKRHTQKKDELKDALGVDVPDELRDLFGDPWLREAFETTKEVEGTVKSVRKMVEKKSDAYGSFLLSGDIHKSLSSALIELEIAKSHLHEGIPHAVCPKCHGKKCQLCRKSGWLPKFRYDELKKEGQV